MVHLHGGRPLQIAQVLLRVLDDVLQVGLRVGVVRRVVAWLVGEQRKVRAEVLDVLHHRQLVADLLLDEEGGLVGPAAGDVAQCVAAAAEHQQWQAQFLHVLDAFAVAVEAEVEAAEAVGGERVGAALQHNGRRLVVLHNVCDDGLEDEGVVGVVDAVLQRHVHCKVPPAFAANLVHITGTGEEVVAVLVEGHRHHAVRQVEGLLNKLKRGDLVIRIINKSYERT